MIKKIDSQVIKYIFFGLLNTVITFVLYVFLIKLGVQYLIASTICYGVGIIEGFIFNGVFVFGGKLKLSSLSKYSLVYVVAYFINVTMLYCLVDYVEINQILSQIIVTVIVTLLSFKLVKWLVF